MWMPTDGPSVLVRKQLGTDFSAYANYYVDSVTSASIDVVTTATLLGEAIRRINNEESVSSLFV